MIDRNTPPVVTDFAELRLPAIQRLTLANGATLIVIPNGTQPVAQLSLTWDGGWAEAPNIAVAKLVGGALREGTPTMDADEIAELIDFNGAQLRTNVTMHHSSVAVSALSEKLPHVLPTVLDFVTNPSFPVDRVDKLRQQYIAARQVQLERVEVLAAESNMRLFAGAEHYSSRQLHTEDFQNATIEQLKEYHKRVYTPSKLTAYLAGDLSESLITEVSRQLQALPPSGDGVKLEIQPFKGETPTTTEFVEKPGALQRAVRFAIPTIDRHHPDYALLRIAVFALGGYFGSRLMSNIREERGLTYGISAALCGYLEGGVVEIAASTSPHQVEELIAETLREIERMVSDPLTPDELQRVRRGYFTRIAGTLDTPFGVSDFVMAAQHNNSPDDYFDRLVKAVETFTPEECSRVFREYIDLSKAIITVAGVKQ